MQTKLIQKTTENKNATAEPSNYAKIFSKKFFKSYLITMRPYLLFVSGITGIAGLSFSPDINLLFTILLGWCFFLSYGFGQALTDCFQMDTDSISSPYRPLVKGEINKYDVIIISLSGLVVIGLIISFNNLLNLGLSLLAVIGLSTYTYFKRKWWGGPFYNSWIVALLCVMAFLSTGLTSIHELKRPELISALAAVFFGYANFVLSGYFKDISADKASEYHTFPVIFGMKLSSYVSDIFATLMIAGWGGFIYFYSILNDGIEYYYFILFAIPGIIVSFYAQYLLHKTRSENESHKPIALVVHTYILLLSSIVSVNKPAWTIALIIFYYGFIVTMKLRPMRQQI